MELTCSVIISEQEVFGVGLSDHSHLYWQQASRMLLI